MYRIFFLLFFFTQLSDLSFGQMNRYTSVDWVVTTDPGLSNGFAVKMILHDKKGKVHEVSDYPDSYKWEELVFISKDLYSFYHGVGSYKIQSDFEGKDSIKVEVRSKNPALNSEFYIPVKYCQSLILENNNLDYYKGSLLNWKMVMNTGEVFPFDKDWANFDRLVNESDPQISTDGSSMKLNATLPLSSVNVRFVSAKSKKIVTEKRIKIDFSNELMIDFKGRSGRPGYNGQSGSMASQSGTHGESGENGLDAENVTVYVRPYGVDSLHLLEVFAKSGNRMIHLFVSSSGYRISIDASGGQGGNGGNGGNGANAVQTENSYSRLGGGIGGSGGYGGSGGNGGNVSVVFDHRITPDANGISVNIEGGKAGNSGNPGSGGRNDRGDDGLLYRIIVKDERTPGQPATDGQNGYDGSYLGLKTIPSLELEELLKINGWQ